MPTDEQVAAYLAANATLKQCLEARDIADLNVWAEAWFLARNNKTDPKLAHLCKVVEFRIEKQKAYEDASSAQNAAFLNAYGPYLKGEQK